MNGRGRFRYVLEPVRLTRQWELDGLLIELADANTALAERQDALRAVLAQADGAQQEWRAMAQGTLAMTVDRFTLLARYLADCRERQRECEALVKEAEDVRDALIERVTAVRKALDAVEEHRGKMRAKHVQQRLSGDFKAADDQWGMLRRDGANDEQD